MRSTSAIRSMVFRPLLAHHVFSSALFCCTLLNIYSLCTTTSFGALIPGRTCFPLTPSTVTVTSCPIVKVSPTFRVRISALISPTSNPLAVFGEKKTAVHLPDRISAARR
jgi:hypothetical protein